MPPRIRALPRQSGAAFTLVELLLATALLMLLVGAIAFNFNSLRQGQSLDEGATQFEALIRLARAHAAASGRPVHMGLVSADSSTNAAAASPSPSGSNALVLVVVTQPDPLRRPEFFQPLPATLYLLGQLGELVRLEIPIPDPALMEAPDLSDDPMAGDGSPFGSGTNSPASDSAFTPFLTFQPDGSSGPADFILHSQDPEDPRRIHIRLDALTGTLRRRYVPAGALNPLEELPGESDEDRFEAEPGVTWDKNDPAFRPVTNQFGP